MCNGNENSFRQLRDQIIEVSDNRGSVNQGCTVHMYNVHHWFIQQLIDKQRMEPTIYKKGHLHVLEVSKWHVLRVF